MLDEQGDILDTIGVTRTGFEYLRRTLRFRRVDASPQAEKEGE